VNYASYAVGDIERAIEGAEPLISEENVRIEVFGAAVSARLRRKIRDVLNAKLVSKYSSNETNVIATVDDDNVGTLFPGVEARIVDCSGRDVTAGEAGLIQVKTETMVSGYFNDEAMTNAAFINGWYLTGDLGVMPEPGKLIVLGRADSMLNVGGLKVAPARIEDELKSIDGVRDAAVMSVVNENGVGVLVAAVETAGGRPSSDLSRRIGNVLSSFAPAFEMMTTSRSLPRTATGKVERHQIEAAFRRLTAKEPNEGWFRLA
jgi:acyl-coenzyme A synthetase/AMP-(fatty) acid ligase